MIVNKDELMKQVQKLSQDYYNGYISYSDYQHQRFEVLKELDEKLNKGQ